MDVAGNLPRRRVGATLHFERTDVAVEFGGAVAQCIAVGHSACGMQRLVVRTDIDASALVLAKVVAGEGAVISLAGITDRNKGRNPAANQPTEKTAGAISRVSR